MDIQVVADRAAISERVAALVTGWATEAVAARGRAVLAFSGGSTPGPTLERLAGADLPWERIHVAQVDERVAPDGDPDRNWTMFGERLFAHAPIPEANRHPMPVTAADLDAAAAAYAVELATLAGDPPQLDVVHLGLGDDGHTASLAPGDPVCDVRDADVAVTGVYRGRRRMTLTVPAINRATWIVWEVAGAGKAEALREALRGDRVPGSLVRREPAVTIVCDTEAAARL